MTDHAPIQSVVDAEADRLISELIDYLRQPSVSATGEGFPDATQRTARAVAEADMHAEIWPTDGRPAVFGSAQGRPGAPTVLIYGHYDVQPPGPLEAWHTPPFEPSVRNERIWGRGAGDNKGQHFAHLQAVHLLGRAGELPCTVKMLLDGEEEVGSPHLAGLVEARRGELAADVVIYSDGPVHASGRWCVKHGVRGILGVALTVRTARRDVHSGNFGNVAPDACAVLVRAIASVYRTDGQVAVEGFYDDVEPLSAADRAALSALPQDVTGALHDLGLDAMDPAHDGLTYYERLCERPTLTINGVLAGDLRRTAIPAEAQAHLDVRLVAGQRPERVFRQLVDHFAHHAPQVRLSKTLAVPPARTSVDNRFTKVIGEAIAAATAEEPLLVPALGGTLPTYVWTEILGLPTLGIPFANVDEANHAPNENMEVRRYLDGIKISVATQHAIGRAGLDGLPA